MPVPLMVRVALPRDANLETLNGLQSLSIATHTLRLGKDYGIPVGMDCNRVWNRRGKSIIDT